ncbi:MAG: hypothetical protein WCT04_13935 [Planctomycetota bacterium]
MTVYNGNIPSNVNKDAKYSVVNGAGGKMQIRLIFRLSAGEKALVTTTAHPELVKKVNRIKTEYSGAAGGAFYINEFGHVLVPVDQTCYCAGKYDRFLEFDFEGIRIGPQAPEGMKPGEVWKGPRVGVAYTLTAGGKDIRYEKQTRPNVMTEFRLSKAVNPTAAARLAKRLSQHKPNGGRIYINEAREFFSPMELDGEWNQIYLGNLAEDEWFTAPDIELH